MNEAPPEQPTLLSTLERIASAAEGIEGALYGIAQTLEEMQQRLEDVTTDDLASPHVSVVQRAVRTLNIGD